MSVPATMHASSMSVLPAMPASPVLQYNDPAYEVFAVTSDREVKSQLMHLLTSHTVSANMNIYQLQVMVKGLSEYAKLAMFLKDSIQTPSCMIEVLTYELGLVAFFTEMLDGVTGCSSAYDVAATVLELFLQQISNISGKDLHHITRILHRLAQTRKFVIKNTYPTGVLPPTAAPDVFLAPNLVMQRVRNESIYVLTHPIALWMYEVMLSIPENLDDYENRIVSDTLDSIPQQNNLHMPPLEVLTLWNANRGVFKPGDILMENKKKSVRYYVTNSNELQEM